MSSSLLVAENLRFDSRLALYHEADKWLAVADLHYGYELSQRASGALFPNWGMAKIEQRITSLISAYSPQTVLFLGDLVHTAVAATPFAHWIKRLGNTHQIVLLRGNHDRQLRGLPLHDAWRIESAVFHHGDRPVHIGKEETIFSGHLHPAYLVSDGAGFQQKLPALCRTSFGWILPAFSPWAAGGNPVNQVITTRWASNGTKIWKINASLTRNLHLLS